MKKANSSQRAVSFFLFVLFGSSIIRALLQRSEGQKAGFCASRRPAEPPPCPPPIGEGSKTKSFFLHLCKKNDSESKPRPNGGGVWGGVHLKLLSL